MVKLTLLAAFAVTPLLAQTGTTATILGTVTVQAASALLPTHTDSVESDFDFRPTCHITTGSGLPNGIAQVF